MNVCASRCVLVLCVAFFAGLAMAAKPGAKPAAKADAAAASPLPDIDKAMWIWNDMAALKGGEGVAANVWFRKTFELADLPIIATVLITADNGYELSINGQAVGSDVGYDAAYWKSIEKYDVSNMMVKGKNVIAVHGIDLGGVAAMIAAFRADFSMGPPVEVRTDATWKAIAKAPRDWQQTETDDSAWKAAVELVQMGGGPWGKFKYGDVAKPAPGAVGAAPRNVTPKELFAEPPGDFRWPDGIVFVADDCSLYDTGRTIFRAGRSRTWSQFDVPGPSLIGRRLMSLRPVKPDANATVLFDAKGGLVGSPSVSYDGKWVYFSHMPAGEKFFRIYRIAAGGGAAERLTGGTFHDFDPAEMPDGRIVFSSTRMGTFEEYHSAPTRGLFALDLAAKAIRSITTPVVFDNDPRITADGRIAFVRADNFGERAKVETQIHVVHPDGTAGVVEFGPDRPGLNYGRANASGELPALLRNYGYGSPAPLSDGRMACISYQGLLLAEPGETQPRRIGNLGAQQVSDISPLPDDRLLCTTAGKDVIGVLDVATAQIVPVYRSAGATVHSATYLGPRTRPAVLSRGSRDADEQPYATGVVVCQSVFNSRHKGLDWSRARAVRIYEGRGLTQRSSHSDIVHIGTQAVEWGTVPLAPDGSFQVEVPADRAMAMQVVDAEGREIINELTWIYVRPGERRSCVGCHAPRQMAPSGGGAQPQALAWPAAKLLGQGRPHRFRANNADNGGTLNLQLERFREVASIDLYELDAPQGPGREAEARRLIAELGGKDAGLKISAAQRLAIFRDRSATAALAGSLFDGDREVRLSAAMALGACGDRTAVAGLAEALGDSDCLVAQAAHASLENLTGQVVAFRPGAARGARGEAAWKDLLEKTPWPKLEAGLIAKLGDGDPLVRRNAVLAIAHVGGLAGAAALRDGLAKAAFADDIRTTLEAIRGLGHLRDAQALGLLGGLMAMETPQAAAQPQVAAPPQPGPAPASELPPGMKAEPKPQPAKPAKPAKPAPRRADVNAYHRAAAAAEAIGRIGAAVPEARSKAEEALLGAYESLRPFQTYCGAYGDHSALHACHASPMHHRIAEALDAIGSTNTGKIVPLVVQSMPTDPDRGLLLETDAVERMIGRVVARSGRADEVIETCLSVLGDTEAKPVEELVAVVTSSPRAWAGNPVGEVRAAQVVSAVCLDAKYGPRVLAALDRYRRMPASPIPSGLGNPATLPTGHWTAFFLARTLGRMKFTGAVDALIDGVDKGSPEASLGRPAAPAVHVLYIHNTMTPCWRAAAADALGRIGNPKAVPALLAAVANFDNATDVRAAAARALGYIADPASADALRKLAWDYPEVSTRRELLTAIANASVKAGR
jgi:HEAT repeat protein